MNGHFRSHPELSLQLLLPGQSPLMQGRVLQRQRLLNICPRKLNLAWLSPFCPHSHRQLLNIIKRRACLPVATQTLLCVACKEQHRAGDVPVVVFSTAATSARSHCHAHSSTEGFCALWFKARLTSAAWGQYRICPGAVTTHHGIAAQQPEHFPNPFFHSLLFDQSHRVASVGLGGPPHVAYKQLYSAPAAILFASVAPLRRLSL